MKNLRKVSIVLISTMFFSFSVQAGRDDNIEKDIYSVMNYSKIFDQREVLNKYPKVLKEEGLDPEKLTKGLSEKPSENIFTKIFHGLTCGQFRKCLRKKEYGRKKKDDGYRPVSTLDDESSDKSGELREIVVEKAPQVQSERSEVEDELDESQTSEMLDKALVKDFRLKKKLSMAKQLGMPLFTFVTDLCAWGGGTFLISKLTSLASGTSGDDTSGVDTCASKSNDTGVGFGMLIIISVTKENFTLFMKSLYHFIWPNKDKLDEYEVLYAKRKRFFPRALQIAIEDRFEAARKDDKSILEAYKYFQKTLELPIKSKMPEFPSEEALKNLLDGHEPPIFEPIENAMFNHFKRFSQKAGTAKKKLKTVIYFVGPAGTRKTYIIKQLAKLMKLPLINLRATKDTKELLGSEDSMGTLFQGICDIENDMARNGMIFIDEFDKVVGKEGASLGVFLRLLERTEEYLKSSYLGAEIDMSHYLIIVAGNSELDCENTENSKKTLESLKALVSRPVIIKSGKVSTWRKQEIVKQLIKEEFKDPENLIGKIDKEGQGYKDLIMKIKGFVEADKDPGVRELQKKVNYEINDFQKCQYRKNQKKLKRKRE